MPHASMDPFVPAPPLHLFVPSCAVTGGAAGGHQRVVLPGAHPKLQGFSHSRSVPKVGVRWQREIELNIE